MKVYFGVGDSDFVEMDSNFVKICPVCKKQLVGKYLYLYRTRSTIHVECYKKYLEENRERLVSDL